VTGGSSDRGGNSHLVAKNNNGDPQIVKEQAASANGWLNSQLLSPKPSVVLALSSLSHTK